jgi:hypothetical protein
MSLFLVDFVAGLATARAELGMTRALETVISHLLQWKRRI